MNTAHTQLNAENGQTKLRQLNAILAAATGGQGVDHMKSGEVQELLNACYALSAEALQSLA